MRGFLFALKVSVITSLMSPMPAGASSSAPPPPGAGGSGPLVENHGQWDDSVRFALRRDQRSIRFRDDAVVIDTPRQLLDGTLVDDPLVLRPLGARRLPQVLGEALVPGRVNVLRGPRERWVRGLPVWKSVRYPELWPHIDLVFRSGSEGALERDVLVAPGGDPRQVCWALEGALSASIGAGGELLIETVHGRVAEGAPIAWQVFNGVRVPVDVAWDLGPGDEVRFWLGPYDEDVALIIDPPMVFATYLGGDRFDEFHEVAVDDEGGVIVVGSAMSPGLATPDATTLAGGVDALIARYTPKGELDWATYFGGAVGPEGPSSLPTDEAWDVSLLDDGGIVVVGATRSADLPTTNGSLIAPTAPTDPDDALDAFVLVLDEEGGEIRYLSYLGGARPDRAIAVDVSRSRDDEDLEFIAVGGWTRSLDFPRDTLSSPCSSTNVTDGFVTVIRHQGLGTEESWVPVMSTCVGGDAWDEVSDLAFDADDKLFVVGSTQSSSLFALPEGMVVPVKAAAGGDRTGFLAELDPLAKTWLDRFLWLRAVGGSAEDWLHSVAIQADGDVVVVGETTSSDLATPDAMDSSCGGVHSCFGPVAFDGAFTDGFVSIISKDGGTAKTTTYLGGVYGDRALDVSVDAAGQIYVTGDTWSYDFPVVAAMQPFHISQVRVEPTPSGALALSLAKPESLALDDATVALARTRQLPGYDDFSKVFGHTGFLAKLDETGKELLLSTYYGGPTFSPLNGTVCFGTDVDWETDRAAIACFTDSAASPLHAPAQASHGGATERGYQGMPPGYTHEADNFNGVLAVLRTRVADLRFSEAAAEPRGAEHGGSTTLKVTSVNDGAVTANNVSLRIQPDTQLGASVAWAVPLPSGCVLSGRDLLCARASLERKASWTMSAAYTNPEGDGIRRYEHRASLIADEVDPNESNNVTTIKTTVGGFDLAIATAATLSKDEPDPGATGSSIAFSWTLANRGPEETQGALFVCPLPHPDATFEGFADNTIPCAYHANAKQLECALEDAIAKDESLVVNYLLTAPPNPTTLRSTCRFEPSPNLAADDADPGNNTHSLTTEIRYPDLALGPVSSSMAPSEGKIRVAQGTSITFGVEIENKGPGDVDPVFLRYDIPDDTMVFVEQGSGWFDDEGAFLPCVKEEVPGSSSVIVCGGLSLDAKERRGLQITMQAPTQDVVIDNTFTVSTGGGEATPADNQSSLKVYVGGVDLALSGLLEDKDPLVNGELVTYRFDVANRGSSDLTKGQLRFQVAGAGTATSLEVPGASCAASAAGGWQCDGLAITANSALSAIATGTGVKADAAGPDETLTAAFVVEPTLASQALEHLPVDNSLSTTTTVTNGADLVFLATETDPSSGEAYTAVTPERIAEMNKALVRTRLMNKGPGTARDLSVELSAGTKASIVFAAIGVGEGARSCNVPATGATSARCDWGDLAKDEAIDIGLALRADDGAAAQELIGVTVTARSPKDPDPSPADAVLFRTVAVVLGADLRLDTPTATPILVAEGGALQASVRICNEGAEDAEDTEIGVSFPLSDATLKTLHTDACPASAQGDGWSCGLLAANACKTLLVDLTVKTGLLDSATPDATRPIKVVFSGSTSSPDRDDDNDTTNVTATVTHATQLGLSVESPGVYEGRKRVAVGGDARWSFRVLNNASDAVNGVELRVWNEGSGLTAPTPPPGCSASDGVFTCAVGTLQPGQYWPSPSDSRTFGYSGEALGSGSLHALAWKPERADKDGKNAVVEAYDVAQGADLALSSSLSPKPAAFGGAIAGGDLTWTVKLCNNGPEDATKTSLTVRVPTDVVELLGTGDVSCTNGEDGWLCPMGSVEAAPAEGACKELVVTMRARTDLSFPPEGVRDGTLTAQLAAETPDLDHDDWRLETKAKVYEHNQLSVSVEAEGGGEVADFVEVDEAFVHMIRVLNKDPDTSRPATLVLPSTAPQVILDGVSGDILSCSGTTTRSCAIDSIAPGTSKLVRVAWTAKQPGVAQHSYAVDPLLDADASDNSPIVAVNVKARQLSLAVEPSGASTRQVDLGEAFAYTLTVSNQNNDPQAPTPTPVLDLSYPLPTLGAPQVSGASCVSGTAPGITRCTLPALAPGAQQQFVARALGARTGTATVLFSLEPNKDLTPEDNSASRTVEVREGADLALSVTPLPSQIAVGEAQTLPITIHNNGPAAAKAARVECVFLGVDTTVSAVPSGCAAQAGILTCGPRALAADQDWTLDIGFTPAGIGALSVTCTAHQTPGDTKPGNDSASASTDVKGADLELILGSWSTQVEAGDVASYPVEVLNHGPATAGGIELVLTPPLPGLVWTSSTWPCAGVASQIVCQVGDLAVGGGASGTFALTAMQAGTWTPVFEARARSVADDGTAANSSAALTVVLPSTIDTDADGVPDDVEDAAPNQGDGDNDGVKDSQQEHVTSITDSKGRFTTFVVPPGVRMTEVAFVAPPANPPAGVRFSTDFWSFKVDVGLSGGQTTVDIILPAGIPAWAYYKYGPTPGDTSAHWYDFNYDGTTGVERLSASSLRMHLGDGARGDDDLVADGVIVDPGAPILSPLVFVVDSASDLYDTTPGDGTCATASGVCSLRAAIEELNAGGEPGEIRFDIGAGGGTVQVLNVGSETNWTPLPVVTVPVIIDGTTQAGWDSDGLPRVALDGFGMAAQTGGEQHGLELQGGASAAAGLIVYGFSGDGLRFSGLGRGHVRDCALGVNFQGDWDLGIGGAGARFVAVGDNLIEDCYLAAGGYAGLAFDGGGADRNRVHGNQFGTSYDGLNEVGHSMGAVLVRVTDGANNLIGGSTADERNVLVGMNGGETIRISGSNAQGNIVAGNYVGLESTGDCTWKYPDGHPCNDPDSGLTCPLCTLSNDVGVRITDGAHDNRVGGTAPGEQNAFGDNESAVLIEDGAHHNVVLGNTFGTNAAGGCGERGCPGDGGVHIDGAHDNVVGGAGLTARNYLTRVRVSGAAALDNRVEGNWFNLMADGRTAWIGSGTSVTLDASARTSVLDNVFSGDADTGESSFLSGTIGVHVTGSDDNLIDGNHFATTPDGDALLAGGAMGIGVYINEYSWTSSSGNVVTANVFSDVVSGVRLLGAVHGTSVEDNRFGLGLGGEAFGVSMGYGVSIHAWTAETNPPSGNVIRGNVFHSSGKVDAVGSVFYSAPNAAIGLIRAEGTLIAENQIGVEAGNPAELSNEGWGVVAAGSKETSLRDNVIGNNALGGVRFEDNGVTGHMPLGSSALGNRVGLDSAGDPAPNGGPGIQVHCGSWTGADLTIGPAEPGDPADANVIKYNAGPGVFLSQGADISVRGNVIDENEELGIDLGWPGVDLLQSDVNRGARAPSLSSAIVNGATTTITGTLQGNAGSDYTVDIYAVLSPDPTGYGEAGEWLGSGTVTIGSDLEGNIATVLPFGLPQNSLLTACATGPEGGSSEFAHVIIVDGVDVADLEVIAYGTEQATLGNVPNNYQATVTNRGQNDALDVVFSFELPEGALVSEAYAQSGAFCDSPGRLVSCALGSMAVGVAETITLNVRFDQAMEATWKAHASASSEDRVQANNTVTGLTLAGGAGLSLSGLAEPSAIPLGGIGTLTLSVRDAAYFGAAGVQLTGVLPGALEPLAAGAGQGSCTIVGQSLDCALGELAPAAEIEVNVSVLALAPGDGIAPRFVVSADGPELTPDDNELSLDLNVHGLVADLRATLTASASPVALGAVLTHTATVTNWGPHDVGSFDLDVFLSDSFLVGEVTRDDGGDACAIDGTRVVCPVGSLAAGEALTVTASAETTWAGQTRSQVYLNALPDGLLDPALNNNSPWLDTDVGPVDLSLVMTSAESDVPAGGDADWTVTVVNDGPFDSLGTPLYLTLPAGLTLREASPSQGTCGDPAPSLTCELGALAFGETATLRVLMGGVEAAATLSAVVQTQAYETSWANNSASHTVDLRPGDLLVEGVDLRLSGAVAPDAPRAGEDPVVWTLDVENRGTEPAQAVGVEATLAGLLGSPTLESSVGACTLDGDAVSCELGALASEGHETVTITATPSAEGTVSLSGSASTASVDVDASNDQVQLSVDVGSAPGTCPGTGLPPQQLFFDDVEASASKKARSGLRETNRPCPCKFWITGRKIDSPMAFSP